MRLNYHFAQKGFLLCCIRQLYLFSTAVVGSKGQSCTKGRMCITVKIAEDPCAEREMKLLLDHKNESFKGQNILYTSTWTQRLEYKGHYCRYYCFLFQVHHCHVLLCNLIQINSTFSMFIASYLNNITSILIAQPFSAVTLLNTGEHHVCTTGSCTLA